MAVELDPATILVASLGIFALSLLVVGGMTLSERRARASRILLATGKRSGGSGGALQTRSGGGSRVLHEKILRFMKWLTSRFALMKGNQIRETKLLLISAGYRSRDGIVIYTFLKLVSPLVFLAGASLYVFGLDPIGKGQIVDILAVMVAALAGSKLPDILLKNTRQKRTDSVRKALPDSLDMLVICAEAGLASDAALKRVVSETGRNGSILSEELHLTAMELGFMPDRRQALENLAERVPIPPVNAFVNSMIQAEKYGTPLAKAFKVLSMEQRTERMLRAEEKASRLPATMTIPMMMFILPALFVVLIGPAILDIADNFVGMER